MTDAEPCARLLGPYAVVDLVRGTPAETVALRQRSGYYALAEELLELTERDSTSSDRASPGEPRSSPGLPSARNGAELPLSAPAPRLPSPASTAATGEPGPGPPTVAERIAPRKRQSTPEVPTPPRGRFTQLDSQRAAFDELEGPEHRESLERLLQQHGHRAALLRALAHGYSGPRRSEPTAPQLDALLAHHGLLAKAEARERALVLAEVREARGALGRAAWALGLRPGELRALSARLGLDREIEELRERFRREALAPAHWTARLDLLGRRKYLQDLGLEPRFSEALRRDLQAELAGTAAALHERLPTLARRLGVAPELLARTLDRLDLSPEADPSAPSIS